MLDPRAYRAALLEELTSAATSPLQADNDRRGTRHADPIATSPVAVSALAPPPPLPSSTAIRLSRPPDAAALSRRTTVSPSLSSSDGCVIENSVVRHGSLPSYHNYSSYEPENKLSSSRFAGHTYRAGEEENSRSLILSFIDNCLCAGVPETTIAEQVQFMVASMQESIAMHAALHAQRQKERVREYEIGELTNMLERQQRQFAQQLREQAEGRDVQPASYTSPPRPLAAQAAPSPLRRIAEHPARALETDVPALRHLYNSPLHATEGKTGGPLYSPQRRAPSPPLHDSPFVWPTRNRGNNNSSSSEARAGVPLSTWRRTVSPDKEGTQARPLQYAKDRLSAATQRNSQDAVGAKEREASAPRSRSRGPSHRTGKAYATQQSAASPQRNHHTPNSEHPHALCVVCLRSASADKRKASQSASTSFASAAAAARRRSSSRTSPPHDRQRYVPAGHYMKPTHASLVRRAAPSSPSSMAPPLSTTSPPRAGQHPQVSPGEPRPLLEQTSRRGSRTAESDRSVRKLVVRSTLSSRLRAAAAAAAPKPQSMASPTDSDRDSDEGNSGDSDSAHHKRHGSASATRDSESLHSSVVSVNEEGEEKEDADDVEAAAAHQGDRGRARAASVDLYASEPPAGAARAESTKQWKRKEQHVPSSRPSTSTHARLRPSTGAAVNTPGSAVDGAAPQTAQRPRRTPPPVQASPSAALGDGTAAVESGMANHSEGVCVTSPELQLFLEVSQRKVRETDRLLEHTAGRSIHSPALPSPRRAGAASNPPSSASPATFYGVATGHGSVHATTPVRHTGGAAAGGGAVASPDGSPVPDVRRLSLWSSTSAHSNHNSSSLHQQQQRLHDLHSRLKAYETPTAPHRGGEGVQRGGDATAPSDLASCASPSLKTSFRLRYAAPGTHSVEHSPLIQISPTSSDECSDEEEKNKE